MVRPQVSIVIPVYKNEESIRTCLDSVLTQTLSDLQVVVIDDGSPDACGAILEQYAKSDPRVLVLHQPNLGQNAARNAGVAAATGEYLGFVDGDDYVESTMYEYMLDIAKKHQTDIVNCGVWREDRAGNRSLLENSFQKNVVLGPKDIRPLIGPMIGQARDFWFLWRNLYRREFFDSLATPFDTTVRYGADTSFNMLAFFHAQRLYADENPLYHYVDNPKSIIQAPCKQGYLENLTHTYETRKVLCKGLGMKDTDFMYGLAKLVIEKFLPALLVNSARTSDGPLRDEIRRIRESPMLVESMGWYCSEMEISLTAKLRFVLFRLGLYPILSFFLWLQFPKRSQ
jgi:glycosyltransferase EpsJ